MNLDQALDYARAVGLTDRQIAVVVRQEADRVRFHQSNPDQVTIVHPITGGEADVHPDAADELEKSGWVRKEFAARAFGDEQPPTDETPDEPAARKPRKATT